MHPIQRAAPWLAKQNLSKEQYRILFFLMSRLNFQSYICMPQKEIAERLQLPKSHVSRGIKAIVELGVVLVGPKEGKSKTFRLNPDMGLDASPKAKGNILPKQAVMTFDNLPKCGESQA